MNPLLVKLWNNFDRHALWRNGTIAISAVSAMHIIQAGVVVTWPNASGATSLLALLDAMHAIGAPDGVHLLATVMLFTALSALFGSFFSLGPVRLGFLLPQHMILGIMTLGSQWAAVNGVYLDGTVIPWPHIFADQIFLPAMFIIHSHAISTSGARAKWLTGLIGLPLLHLPFRWCLESSAFCVVRPWYRVGVTKTYAMRMKNSRKTLDVWKSKLLILKRGLRR